VNEGDRRPEQDSQRPRDERRRASRIPLQAVVHYQIDGSEHINLSSDISGDGIFIKNFSPPLVGTELTIQVHLPDDLGCHQVDLVGRVVRVNEGSGSTDRGMGVEFTSVQACSPEAVRFFVKEVYEVNRLARVESTSARVDGEPGEEEYRYVPEPGEVLRLRGGKSDEKHDPAIHKPAISVDPRQRIIWSALLISIGALLGAGLVLVFFLGE
jgi:hypothetical protein